METTWLIRTDLPHWYENEDPLDNFLRKNSLRYIAFDEIGKQGAKKEHQHIVMITTTNKKDTIRHQLTAAFPELKATRKGSGGETRYSISKYESTDDYGYVGFRLHYVCKDGNHRCGELWSNDEWNEHRKKREQYIKDNCPPPGKKKNKVSQDQQLRVHLNKLFKEKGYFYDPDNCPSYESKEENYERTLALEIYKYYQKYGKSTNRNWVKVAAEQLLYYAPIYAPTDKIRNEATAEVCKAILAQRDELVYRQ